MWHLIGLIHTIVTLKSEIHTLCHIVLTFLAGSMLQLVGNPQEYVYIMFLSHLEQILQ